MPNLKHLLDELKDLGVEPKQIRIPGQLYDSMVSDAEEIIEENPEDREESTHPIPQSLVQLFAVPITLWHPEKVDREFKKLCKQAAIELPKMLAFTGYVEKWLLL